MSIRGGPRKRTLRGMLPGLPSMPGRVTMRRTRQEQLESISEDGRSATTGSGMQEALASQMDVSLGTEKLLHHSQSNGAKRLSIQKKCQDDEWDCRIEASPVSKKPNSKSKSKEPLRPDPTMVANIVSMGFARTRVIEALTVAQNDPNRAISYLTRKPGVVMF
mmetsp:Transcript_113779/g.196716  ORF Transcript_113779/g.196716 Transcript_113779/m.196716 type:complete len:163 (+) Transcript_113779:81-569(+)